MRRSILLLALLTLLQPTTSARSLAAQGADLLAADVEALARFRPGYAFWGNVFTIPDGSVVFGSESDGHLVATFPAGGDWAAQGLWTDPGLARVLEGRALSRRLTDRRDEVAAALGPEIGPVVHNPTRGDFVTPNARRFGSFLEEWGTIYERFGVPAELGLAQAIVESGLSGTVKSEARAIGFCQWLPRNWERLQRLTDEVIEVQNQTTQAPFCAAYLAVLAVKYGSFIPALSEHHAGGANVGRAVINGGRLGGSNPREQYLVGSRFAKDLRVLSPGTFRELLGTYGPRSYLYAEMVFGNMPTAASIMRSTPQERIFAQRVSRAVSIEEVARTTGLPLDEIKRFNPALVRQVPKGATLYLPAPVEGLGVDVDFWHRPAPASYTSLLAEFLSLKVGDGPWESLDFEPVLSEYRRRFLTTDTEEGRIMASAIAYAVQELPATRRVLDEFRTSARVERLFEDALKLRSPETG